MAAQDVIDLVDPIMAASAAARKSITAARAPAWESAVADGKTQLKELTDPGFLNRTPWGWLQQYPRYLEAITVRMQKLAKNGAPRDQRSLEVIQRCLEPFRRRSAEHAEREHFDPQLDYYGWMIQELRVSLFAQELGTAIPVSEVRLKKQWEKVSD
jgi:ATP-dependent helicase HrpA